METKKLKGEWLVTPKTQLCGYLLAVHYTDFTTDYINVWTSDFASKMKELGKNPHVMDVKVYGRMNVDFEPERDEQGEYVYERGDEEC